MWYWIVSIRYCLAFPQGSEWQLAFRTDLLNEDTVEVDFTINWELQLSNKYLFIESLQITWNTHLLLKFLQPDLRKFLYSWLKTSWKPSKWLSDKQNTKNHPKKTVLNFSQIEFFLDIFCGNKYHYLSLSLALDPEH